MARNGQQDRPHELVSRQGGAQHPRQGWHAFLRGARRRWLGLDLPQTGAKQRRDVAPSQARLVEDQQATSDGVGLGCENAWKVPQTLLQGRRQLGTAAQRIDLPALPSTGGGA